MLKYSLNSILKRYNYYNIQKNLIHFSCILNGSRNDGASGGVEKPREFSKKQKKRHKKKVLELKEKKKRDPLKKQKKEAIESYLQSPETQEFIKELEPNILAAVREASLPEGLQSILEEIDKLEDVDDDLRLGNIQLHDITTRLLDQLETLGNNSENNNNINNNENSSKELMDPITSEEINNAVLIAGQRGSKKYINSLLYAMEKLEFPLYSETVTTIMQKFIELEDYEYAEAIFEKSLDTGTNPNSDTWAELIKLKASSGNLDDAQKTMDRLIKIGVNPTPKMYFSILRSLLECKKNDEAFEYWMRMKAEGTKLNVEAYNLMLQHTIQTYNPERAFLYFDEMRGYGRDIQPNAESFAKLFESCGNAPMWVNGFHDIMFDAMAVMEGAEFPPSTEIYNSIILSFGKGGDCAASEFYFWEMRQKGIPQNVETYNSLFRAFGLCQRVGHGPYMIKPKYVRPPEREKSELEELMLKAGAIETQMIKSESFSSDGIPERGKRQKHNLTTIDDEMSTEEYEQHLINQLKVRTMGQESRYELVKKRDEENKELYYSETGRKITLDLLKKGVDPGPGRILHIEPGSDDEVDEPTNEELFSIGQGLKSSPSPSSSPSPNLFDDENLDLESIQNKIKNLDDLPDDDPEFLEFMKAFKESMGENNYDSMLESLGNRIDQQSDGHNFIPNPNNPSENLLNDYDVDDLDDEKKQKAQQSIDDIEKGLIDLDTMESGRVSTKFTSTFDEELDKLKQTKLKQTKLKKEQKSNVNDYEDEDENENEDYDEEYENQIKNINLKANNNNNNNKSSYNDNNNSGTKTTTSSTSFDFDSVSLGDPELLKVSNLVKEKQKNHLLALLDNEAIPDEYQNNNTSSQIGKYKLDENGVIPAAEVERQWNYVLFARCPEPDYSKPLPERRKEHIIRANTLYRDMIEHNIEPNIDTMNAYLSVFTEATKLDDALNLLDKFASQHDFVPNETTYHHLVRMHIYLKDINGALNRFHEMKERNITPSGKTYGSLIQSLSHRDNLVDALKLLEEAHDKNIHISNTYIKKLRRRCEKLGVSHPYIPPDPEQWVKDVKEVRRKAKGKPIGSKVHIARGLSYY